MLSWDIKKRSPWPWDKIYGSNQSIEIKDNDKVIMTISAVEIIECLGKKFVEAHVKECNRLTKNNPRRLSDWIPKEKEEK